MKTPDPIVTRTHILIRAAALSKKLEVDVTGEPELWVQCLATATTRVLNDCQASLVDLEQNQYLTMLEAAALEVVVEYVKGEGFLHSKNSMPDPAAYPKYLASGHGGT